MTYQTLLVINGVLIGGLLLSLYFVARNRSRAIRAESELKDVRKDLEISENRVGHYRARADHAESELKNSHEKARLTHESLRKVQDQSKRDHQRYQDDLKHLKDTIRKLENDLGEARDQIETAGDKGNQEKSKDTRDQAEGDSDIPWPAEAVKEFANEFLDSLDGFDLGLIHARKQNLTQVDDIVDGIEIARDKLVEAVGKLGIEIFDPKDEPFDPKIHRAIGLQPSDKVAPRTILFVARKGCLFNEQIMRFADVIIAK